MNVEAVNFSISPNLLMWGCMVRLIIHLVTLFTLGCYFRVGGFVLFVFGEWYYASGSKGGHIDLPTLNSNSGGPAST